jgi:Spy/CpxP family protein refolding chaperone
VKENSMHPGFVYRWKRRRECAHHTSHAAAGHGGWHAAGHGGGGGAGFGVRRPLRVMSHELELSAEQSAVLARVIDALKTERAQAAVDERRSIGMIADAMTATDFDREAVDKALELRVRSAERLREAVAKALEQTHAMLEPEQRERLAYLLRSGTLTI